jgi:hypothetical protein
VYAAATWVAERDLVREMRETARAPVAQP